MSTLWGTDHVCGRRNDIITILSNREYMDGLCNKLLFIKALQKEELTK